MRGAGKRIALLVVVAVLAGAGSGVLLVRALDGPGDSGGDGDGEVAEQFAEAGSWARTVVDALGAERNRASIDLTGSAATIGASGSLPETPELRASTDRSIADLTSALGRSDPEVAALYQPALDTLDGLITLRTELDARPGPGTPADLEYADQTFQRYADLAAPLREAVGEGLPRITDDPALRQGLVLDHAASEQVATLTSLFRTLVLAATGTGTLDDQDEVTEVAELQARFATTAETIRGTDRSPYREVVEGAFPEQLTTDVTSTVTAALAGEPIDLETVMALSDTVGEPSYEALAQQARAETRRHADRLADDRRSADADDVLWLVGATLTGLVALAALATAVITGSRRTPPPGPPLWPPTPSP
jgi:hypothetical protein